MPVHTITIDLFQDEADFTVRIVSDGEKIPEASSQQIFVTLLFRWRRRIQFGWE